ncbi:unnamed protein product, partial [Iphiclides podalirius]
MTYTDCRIARDDAALTSQLARACSKGVSPTSGNTNRATSGANGACNAPRHGSAYVADSAPSLHHAIFAGQSGVLTRAARHCAPTRDRAR